VGQEEKFCACGHVAEWEVKYEIKKAIPIEAWTSPLGSRMFRLPDFMTIGTRRW